MRECIEEETEDTEHDEEESWQHSEVMRGVSVSQLDLNIKNIRILILFVSAYSFQLNDINFVPTLE